MQCPNGNLRVTALSWQVVGEKIAGRACRYLTTLIMFVNFCEILATLVSILIANYTGAEEPQRLPINLAAQNSYPMRCPSLKFRGMQLLHLQELKTVNNCITVSLCGH